MDSVGSCDMRSAEMLPALLLEPSLNIYTRQSRDKVLRQQAFIDTLSVRKMEEV